MSYQTLGQEGNSLYYTDGTIYPYPDGTGAAVQVWESRYDTKTPYCLLSEWKSSHAYKRLAQPQMREKRSLYTEFGPSVFDGLGPIRGLPV